MRPAYRDYLVMLLMGIMVFNYVDRVAMGLLLQDIKTELVLSDTQLGLLTGLAFALFYALMGIPIARWADRGNRAVIISVTTALWSVAVACCAGARSFAQLLLIRVGVAVGEAGCHPPALSLIADYFDRAERPKAVARYMLGWPIALLIGFFGGGWLDQFYGWRVPFVVLGLPGLVLAGVAAVWLREPRRLARRTPPERQGVAVSDSPQPSGREVASVLWHNASFRNLLLCFSLSYFFGNGALQWLPAFFMRSHHLTPGAVGTWFAVIYGLGGLLGTYLGGEWASRFAADNERLQFIAMAVLHGVLALVAAAVYVMPNPGFALAILSLSSIGSAMVSGPSFAATQTIVPARMRATAIAVVLFFCNLIGLGCGPLAVGALSDLLRSWVGAESLRYALLLLCPGYFVCAWLLVRASRSVSQDVAASATWGASVGLR